MPLEIPTTISSDVINNHEILNVTVSPDDTHTLEIVAGFANAFFLDYILIQSSSAFISDLHSETPDSFPATTSIVATGPLSTSTQLASGNSTRNISDVGTIIGVVIGSLVSIAIFGFIVRRWVIQKDRADDRTNFVPWIDPFPLGTSVLPLRSRKLDPSLNPTPYQHGQRPTIESPIMQPEGSATNGRRVILDSNSGLQEVGENDADIIRMAPPHYTE